MLDAAADRDHAREGLLAVLALELVGLAQSPPMAARGRLA